MTLGYFEDVHNGKPEQMDNGHPALYSATESFMVTFWVVVLLIFCCLVFICCIEFDGDDIHVDRRRNERIRESEESSFAYA